MKHLTLTLTTTLLIFTACSNQEQVRYINKKIIDEKKTKVVDIPKPPKRYVKLQKIEDENFSSDYMYPDTKKSTAKVKVQKNIDSNKTSEMVNTSITMTKEECISMIGQEKFDNYTQMYGDTNLALKKCKMLKEL